MEQPDLVKCTKCIHYRYKIINKDSKICYCNLDKDAFRDEELEPRKIKSCYKERKLNETNCSKSR